MAPLEIRHRSVRPISAKHAQASRFLQQSRKIYFHAVGDYLTRDEKLAELKRNVSIAHTQVNEIVPDAHGDWLNQRDDSYARFMRVDGKKASENSIFKNYSRGVATSRDAWVYGSNKRKVLEHVANSITFYNSQVKALAANPNYEIDLDPKKMKWDRLQKNTILRGKIVEDVSVSKLYLSYYRPFFTQYLYLDRFWNNCVYQMPAIFPTCESKNLLICSSGVGPLRSSSFPG
ncbi:type ISP restriction/modification enzyme [Sutterella wadsworthensis]|uniref:type ISP restriction/modification enzyme n=1 Tax=Sutterella wadsworthensis TaxID=40545 RepID=UPI00402AB1B1